MTDLFDGAGTLREAYRRVDWAATPVGRPETWSRVLRGAFDLTLQTRAPITLLWGPQYVLLYNEAYVEMIGVKHPAALGRPCREVFPEIWDTIGPMLDSVVAGHGATWMEDLRLLMDRQGFLEETYFTFSYSPVRDEDGTVVGAIDIASETTAQVLGNRRLELLSRLNDRIADVEDVADLVEHALPVLRSAPEDLPGVDLLLPGTAALPVVPDREIELRRTDEGLRAWVRLTGVQPSQTDAVLSTRLSPHLAPDAAYLGFLRLLGTALAQGLNRARAREAERQATATQRALAEALQRSLLEPPEQPGHLQVAVRYQPAAEGARIGGDWYDSFVLPDGHLTVVVGDVTGHDRFAAAAMSQVRNLLRGISYAVQRPPSDVLTVLDDSMTSYRLNRFATAVLARVENPAPDRHLMRWSNAGHPPPVLVHPDGVVQLLETRGERLLGTRTTAGRTDHTVWLEPGSTVVFYTDGLIERRGRHLDDGLADLLAALRGHAHLDPEALCEHLLATVPGDTEDDVVLTVLRVGQP
ncbi:PP2C family protein-serine/threonine phosphatase [Actinoplanes sp. N902-109]|uniref:PP2C family protein-serine/threonine phosphatase n=1 Tax=Actinoplanes sp. (strain N902-109) TaxID=649831 RepID=UPI0003293794|nr:SpoIIE family protein phosphatase [Actinoplanes sp. N902-109]AGL17529.1 Stage II sporulation protein E (SpoIIE) [Actinoplanes sp. N902-109]